MTNEPRKAKKTLGGFEGPPADGGLSIDRLAQAFAAMMGEQDPYETATTSVQKVVRIDASPDLDETVNAAGFNAQTPSMPCKSTVDSGSSFVCWFARWPATLK